ncbi:MAG: Uma2 family endonuclease [Gemmatimonadales bacterium]
MPDLAQRYTAYMVRELPDDGNRYEVVHGELLVTPAPRHRHQLVLGRLYAWLRGYLDGLGLADAVLFSPADISWDDETLVQPDVFVVASGEIDLEWPGIKTLVLAVEVLSPSSARADRVIKRRLYQERRVATYWVVDIEGGLVEIWHPGDERPEIITEVLRWRAESGAPELAIDLAELFREPRRP